MSKQIKVVLVGKSPLSLMLAKELDKTIGPLVQYDIIWVTDGTEMVTDLLNFDPVGRVKGVSVKNQLTNTQVRVTTIQSINLRRQEIITSRGSIEYDYLLLDQIPYFSFKELTTIYRQFSSLLGAVSAAARGDKPISALAMVGGNNVNSWQLALSLRSFQLKHFPSQLRQIAIRVDKSPQEISDFLREHAVEKSTSKDLGGIRISAPLPMVTVKQIKGAKVDRAGHLMADPFLRLRGFDNVICFDSPEWLRSNLLRVYQTISKNISQLIESHFDTRKLKKIHIPDSSFLLRSHRGKYAMLGKLKSSNFRAAIIAKLEKNLHR